MVALAGGATMLLAYAFGLLVVAREWSFYRELLGDLRAQRAIDFEP